MPYGEILMLLVPFHGSVHNDRIPKLIYLLSQKRVGAFIRAGAFITTFTVDMEPLMSNVFNEFKTCKRNVHFLSFGCKSPFYNNCK